MYPAPQIIFAEDDVDDQYLILRAFASLDRPYKVHFFSLAEEMVQYLVGVDPTAVPALIVLDYNMPRLNGFQALKLIRSLRGFEQVPVVVFSTNVTEQMRTDFASLGVLACIQKAASYAGVLEQVAYFDELIRDDVDTLLGV